MKARSMFPASVPRRIRRAQAQWPWPAILLGGDAG